MDVTVAVPVREDLDRRVVLSANVRALETTTVYSKVSGYLSGIEVDIGDRVSRGQLIAKIEVPELRDELREAEAARDAAQADRAGAAAELEGAQADAELQELTYERLRAVREEEPDGMPQQTVDEARAAYRRSQAAVKALESRMNLLESEARRAQATMQRLQTLLAYAEIRAPLDGVVTERFVDPGALLQAATSSKTVQRIVTVASLDRVRLLIDVPESEVPFVQAGDPAVLTVDAMPGREFPGEVTRFALALNPATRTMRTEVELENSGWLLRPGMYGRVALSLAISPDAITVPAEALRVDGDRSFVYCIAGGFAKRVNVEAAIRDGVKAEVTSGLEGHEQVVVSARGRIADGIQVNAVEVLPKEGL